MYQIQVTVVRRITDEHGIGWDKTVQLPTFYLDENVQGIINAEHAVKIASQIICPVELEFDSFTANISATKI